MSEIKTRRCAGGLVVEKFFARDTNKFYRNGSDTLNYYFDEHFFYIKSYNEIIGLIQTENIEGEQFANLDLHTTNEFVIHLFDKSAKGGKYFSQTTSKHIGLIKKWIEENGLIYLHYKYDKETGELKQPKVFLETNVNYGDETDNMDTFIIDNFQYIKNLQQ